MPIDRQRMLDFPAVEVPYAYTERDTMLHALGIGMGMDPMDERQLPFVYDDAGLKSFPTMSAVIGWVDLLRDPRFRDPAWGVDASQMVVAQVIIRQDAALPTSGQGKTRTYFAEVVDKGAGKPAFLRVRKELQGAAGAILGTLDTWLLVRRAGGFGGPAAGGPEDVIIPERPPDLTCKLPTPGNLALIYRLSLGDHNALHADPQHARRVGFDRPILHGIANFSIGIHAVLRSALDYDASCFQWGKAKFVKPVFPGDTIVTHMWDAPGAILFRCTAVERNAVVIDGGYVATAPAA